MDKQVETGTAIVRLSQDEIREAERARQERDARTAAQAKRRAERAAALKASNIERARQRRAEIRSGRTRRARVVQADHAADRAAELEAARAVEREAEALRMVEEPVEPTPTAPPPVEPKPNKAERRRATKAAERDMEVNEACVAIRPVLARWPFSTPMRLEEETGISRAIIVLALDKLGVPRKRHERPGW